MPSLQLLQHNLLVHFNFDLWKQGYLQWIANRHYRLSDIFNPKALSALRTDRQLSNISTNTDEVNSDLFKRPTRLSNVSTISQSVYTSSNNIKPQLSNSRSSLIRSSIESLQPLSDNKHKQNVSHKPDEVNCSQFIQAVLHGRPTHDWANPIFIKSAFYTIDQAKKGIVTCHQIIEALSPKKQVIIYIFLFLRFKRSNSNYSCFHIKIMTHKCMKRTIQLNAQYRWLVQQLGTGCNQSFTKITLQRTHKC